MKRVLPILILLIGGVCYTSYGQQAANVHGTITEQSTKPVEFANVILRRAGNEAIFKVAVADTVGAFEFIEIPYGRYTIAVTYLGYQSFSTQEFEVAQPVVKMPSITLTADVKELQGVEVTSKRPLIERKVDRTVVNIESSIMSAGESAMDVLEKSPGVSVDKDGSVMLRGRSGVMIFLDGRPTYLSGGDLANFLRNLQASQLDQIELMTNPPAQYDAAGNAGVINIKTKKIQVKGLNGSFSATYLQGRYNAHNESFIFNYRSGKVNFFSNLTYADRNGYESNYILRNLREEDSNTLQTIYDQNSYTKTNNKSLTAKVGLDYYLGKNTVLGAIVSGYNNPGTSQIENNTLLKNPDGSLQTYTVSPASSRQKWQNLNLDLHFKHTFDTSGRELSADANYLQYNSENRQNFENNYYNPDKTVSKKQTLLENYFPQDIQIYSGKIDYIHPINATSKLEVGAKSSYITTDNDALFQNRVDNQWLKNDTLSNHFVYKENINAVYANYRKKLNQWELQVGVRGEQTTSEGKQLTTNETSKRNYTQLFPTAYLSYTINSENQLALTYGRRIKRPDYQDLNPFQIFLDQYTYEKGNPYLRPQYSHNVEFSHLMYEGAISTTLSYSQTTDIIQPVIRQNIAKNETFLLPENISKSQTYGINMNVGVPLSDLSNFILYWELNRNRFEGNINNKAFSLSATTFSGNAIYQQKFGKGWTIETGVWYNSRSIEGTFMIRPYGKFGAAIKKNILKSRGSLRLSANDVFKWTKFIGTSQYQNIDIFIDNRWQTQTLKLTFTYQFRKGSKLQEKEYSSSAEDAQERIKSQEK